MKFFTHILWDGHWRDDPVTGEPLEWVKDRSFPRGWLRAWRGQPNARLEHTGDEFGNCGLSLTVRCWSLVWYYRLGTHAYQDDVELPDPGECAWVDRVMYGREVWEREWLLAQRARQ